MNLQPDILTMDKMHLAAAQCGLYGMKIIVSPILAPVAKVEIASNFKWITDECRSNINQWLKETFGTKEVCYMLGKDTIVVSPKQAAALRNAIP